jgi:hypothetical protein
VQKIKTQAQINQCKEPKKEENNTDDNQNTILV